MKKVLISIFIIMMLFFTACSNSELPPEPVEPGAESAEGDLKTGAAIGSLDTGSYVSAGSNIVLGSATLDFSDTESLELDVTAKNKDYVWKRFYIMDANADGTGVWKRYEFDSQTANSNTGWIVVDDKTIGANVALTIAKNDLPSSNNYVVVYTCNKINTGFDCNNGKWTYKALNIKTVDLSIDSVSVDSAITPVPTKDTETRVDVVIKNSNPTAKYTTDILKLRVDFDVGDGNAISTVRMDGTDLDLANGKIVLEKTIAELNNDLITKSFDVVFTKNRNYKIKATIDITETGLAKGEVLETDDSNNDLTTENIYIGAATGGTGEAIDFTVGDATVIGDANVNEVTNIEVTYNRAGGGSSYDIALPTAVDFHTGTGNYIDNVKVDGVELDYTSGKYLYNLVFGTDMEKTVAYEVTYTTARTYGMKSWVNYGSDVAEANLNNNDQTFTSFVVVGHGLPSEVDELDQ